MNFSLLFLQPMGNFHYRLNFNPGKINELFHHSNKGHIKISETATVTENPTTFTPISPQKWWAFPRHIRLHTTFATKLGNFTNFKMLFVAVVKDFVRPVWIKI